MPEATMTREDQIAKLRDDLQKQNKKFFREHARSFNQIGDKLVKAQKESGEPELKEQIDVLKNINDQGVRSTRGQKELLANNKKVIWTLEAMKNIDTVNKEQIEDLLQVAKEQRHSLRLNRVEDFEKDMISGLKDVFSDQIGDMAAILTGVISDSPFLMMGVKGIQKAIGGGIGFVKNRIQDKKDTQGEVVYGRLSEIANGQEDTIDKLDSASDSLDNVAAQVQEAFEAIDPNAMRDIMIESFQASHEQVLDEFGLTNEQFQEALKKQGIEINWPPSASDFEQNVDEQREQVKPEVVYGGDAETVEAVKDVTESIEDGNTEQDLALSTHKKILEASNEYLDDIRWDINKQVLLAILQNKLFQRLALFGVKKAGDKFEVVDKAFNKISDFNQKMMDENEEFLQNLLQRTMEITQQKLDGILSDEYQKEDMGDLEMPSVFVEAFQSMSDSLKSADQNIEDIGYFSIEQLDQLKNISGLLSDDASRQAILDQGKEEERREANERHRDMLEVLKNIGEKNELVEDDSFDTEDFLGDFAGSFLGNLGPLLLRMIPIAAIAALLGKAIWDGVQDAVEVFKAGGTATDVFLSLFKGIGDSLMDMAVWVGEAFGFNMEMFKQENRDKWGTLILEKITGIFDAIGGAIMGFIEDIVPDKIQKLAGIGKYKREGPTGDEVLENMNVTRDIGQGQVAVDIGQVGQNLTAQQLQDVIDDKEINGSTLTPEMISSLDQMRDLKQQLADPEVAQEDKKAIHEQLKSLYDQGDMFTEVPKDLADRAFSIVERLGSKISEAASNFVAQGPMLAPAPVGSVAFQVPTIPDRDLTRSRTPMIEKASSTIENLDRTRERERQERLDEKNKTGNVVVNSPTRVNNSTNMIMSSSPYDMDPATNNIDRMNTVP